MKSEQSEQSNQNLEENKKENSKQTVNYTINSQNKSNKLYILPMLAITLLIGVIIGQNMELTVLNRYYLKRQIQMYKSSKSDELDIGSSSKIDKNEQNQEKYSIMFPEVVTLSTGTYKVGKDIASGIYNLRVVSGCGLIHGDLEETYLSELMGIDGYEDYYSEEYKNLYLKNGDEFEISGGVVIKFVPIT